MRKITCLLLIAVGCGGITSGTDGGGAPDVIQPPPPNICPPGQTCAATFVFRALLLGDSTRQGSLSTTAWQRYGENIDGKVTVGTSTDVCQRAHGAATSVQADGVDGIDNEWGLWILPILQSAGVLPNPTEVFTGEIRAGRAGTLLLTIETGPNGTKGKLHVTAPLGKTATFDGTDVWSTTTLPVQDAAASLDYPNATILPDGTFVSGRSPVRFAFTFAFGVAKYPLLMVVDHLQVRTRLGAGMLTATEGTLSGVLPVEPFITQLKVSMDWSAGGCGTGFDGFAQQLRQTMDILGNGTNTTGVPCDAISIGMGFELAPAKLGSPSNLVFPPDPCK